ncbi:hypothetical protein AV530_016746 [Patagioenas fasciata monilis]|uniref:Uncharacterized protein n=1 Tax=Patagioenas fasciata monilis TaxID=372326 RepID=A0A1V4J4M3_PATFA|nr:hypothetical protein AV530_016746 [Patagioenas fasciata monilis]
MEKKTLDNYTAAIQSTHLSGPIAKVDSGVSLFSIGSLHFNQGSLSLTRAPGTAWTCPKASNWRCVSVSGWNCLINPRSPALFWIFVIPYSTACVQMRNHRLLLQSLQRRIEKGLWDGLSSFSGLEMEELLKTVNIVEYEVPGSIYQLDDLVYV